MALDRLKLIRELTNANGIPGFEGEVADIVIKYAGQFARCDEDHMHNVILYRNENTGNQPVVMLDAHLDEIGFMVQYISGNGLIKFLPIGGWSPQNVAAHKVRIRNARGEYVKGVISSKPPHFMSETEKSAPLNMDSLYIDVGAVSRREVVEVFAIEPGNPVVPDADFEYNEANKIICAKALDDRIGVAAVLAVLDKLQGEALHVDLVCALSSQEEVGMRGAQVTSHRISPKAAIVFEGTPADDPYAGEFDSQASLRKGPQVRHQDSTMITHPRFLAFAREVAKKQGIPFQDAVRKGGGTDAGAIHIKHGGAPAIVIGIPARYIHTHYGYCSLEDFDHGVEWVCAILRNLNQSELQNFFGGRGR